LTVNTVDKTDTTIINANRSEIALHINLKCRFIKITFLLISNNLF
jgi:hypothetical protein